MDFNVLIQSTTAVLVAVGLKVLGAILIYLVGRWLINFALDLLRKVLIKQSVDQTLIRYLGSFIAVAANVALVVAILGYFGVETTTFAALVAAIGVAIGAAWGGLLANFAAGVFLVILRPYKVGDFICAGGVTGTVHEVGLFVTTIDTPDNVQTYVANNKIFSDNIQNFTVNPYRRVDLVAQINHSVDHNDAIKRLKTGLAGIPNVLSNPAPDVEILQFNINGPVLAVRPYCNNKDYWQVYFDTNRLIREAFDAAGYPAPEQHFTMRSN
ncbi:mechanosensitive ion channel family protein [Candidatus Cyanaurora vandensis]|uniref:mechanosensitive ion channel family protein n=1 Tax=Candidatus Cyanaurora vandensis TaxID=2714958 RepID=UPI00257E3F43|nr:mechanosensitive ion channel family protein [Candidatus Cyanaurora vandensis]